MNTSFAVEIVVDLGTPDATDVVGTPVISAFYLKGAAPTNTSVTLPKKPSNLELGKPNQADQLLGRVLFLGVDFFLGWEEVVVGSVAIGLVSNKD